MCSVVGLAIGIGLRVSMPVLFLLTFGSVTAVSVATALWLVVWHKPWLRPRGRQVDRDGVRGLLNSGWSFLLIQIAAVVVFSSDNLIVSHYLGAAEVTPYSVTWRLAGFSAVLQSLMFPALWPAYADASARGDGGWIRRTFWLTLRGTLALNLICAAGLVFFGQTVIRWWASAAAAPSRSLLLAMATWSVISGAMSVQSCLLGALNRTRVQAVLSVGAAAMNVAISIALVTRMGSLGVILGTILSYLVVLVAPQTMLVHCALRDARQNDPDATRVARAAASADAW